jgi:PBP1b-binding outer membrane lipoprotein LpoB
MKKRLAIAFVSITLLSGCYTNICPTYAVKPEQKQQLKAEKAVQESTEVKKSS